MGKGGDGREVEGGREEEGGREGGKRRGSSHAFPFLTLAALN